MSNHLRDPAHQDRASWPRRPASRLARALATALLSAAMAVGVLNNSAQGDTQHSAQTARSLNVADTAHLHYTRESGAMLVDEGAATGDVPGTVKIQFEVGATVTASFTIYTRNGSLVGHGSGVLHESSHAPSHSSVYVSFAGSMVVTHGTGRYVHAHGQGGFYGVVDRKTYAATIQTTGTLSY